MYTPFALGPVPIPTRKLSAGIGGRAKAIAAISQSWRLLAAKIGQVYVTSSEVLDALHDLGIDYSTTGRKLTMPNAIGDILGKHSMHLPSVLEEGKNYYFLPAIDMTPEERSAFESLSYPEKAQKVQAIMGELDAHAFSPAAEAPTRPLHPVLSLPAPGAIKEYFLQGDEGE